MGIDEQLICEKTGHRGFAVRAYKRTSTEQEMRVSDILYDLNVQKKAKEETSEDDKCAQKKTIEIESANENQNAMKKAGHSRTMEQNIIQNDIADYEILGKAPINISFSFVMK